MRLGEGEAPELDLSVPDGAKMDFRAGTPDLAVWTNNGWLPIQRFTKGGGE